MKLFPLVQVFVLVSTTMARPQGYPSMVFGVSGPTYSNPDVATHANATATSLPHGNPRMVFGLGGPSYGGGPSIGAISGPIGVGGPTYGGGASIGAIDGPLVLGSSLEPLTTNH